MKCLYISFFSSSIFFFSFHCSFIFFCCSLVTPLSSSSFHILSFSLSLIVYRLSRSLFDTPTDWSVRSPCGALNSIGNYFFLAVRPAQTNCTSHMSAPYKTGMFDPLFRARVPFAPELDCDGEEIFTDALVY